MTTQSDGQASQQQIAVTVDLEPEKPVDIDISQLLEKEGEGEKVTPPDDEKTPPKEAKEPKDDGVEIEIETGDDRDNQDNEVIADLKAQLDALRDRSERERQDIERERKAREEAERTAQQAREQFQQSQGQLLQSNLQALTHAIAAEKADADALERAYAQALQGNDHATAAKCQRALSRVEARMLQLEEGKSQLDEMIKAGPKAWPQPQGRPQRQKTAEEKSQQSSGDPVEDYYRSRSPRVEQFLRKHDRAWISDKKTNDKLVAAHFAAIAADHVNESDSYFDFIEKQMTPKKESSREARPTKKIVAAAPASAVKAASAAANGVNGTKVHLTPRERESARFQGISEAEYARRKYLMSRADWDGPKFD